MSPDRGGPAAAWRNLWSSELPYRDRLVALVRNLGRRLVAPPHDCCGRPGEPGC